MAGERKPTTDRRTVARPQVDIQKRQAVAPLFEAYLRRMSQVELVDTRRLGLSHLLQDRGHHRVHVQEVGENAWRGDLPPGDLLHDREQERHLGQRTGGHLIAGRRCAVCGVSVSLAAHTPLSHHSLGADKEGHRAVYCGEGGERYEGDPVASRQVHRGLAESLCEEAERPGNRDRL